MVFLPPRLIQSQVNPYLLYSPNWFELQEVITGWGEIQSRQMVLPDSAFLMSHSNRLGCPKLSL